MTLSDVQALHEASACLHRIANWLDLQADRIEVPGVLDDEARLAVKTARALLDAPDEEEESPCG